LKDENFMYTSTGAGGWITSEEVTSHKSQITTSTVAL
jgi:hypothetical protein